MKKYFIVTVSAFALLAIVVGCSNTQQTAYWKGNAPKVSPPLELEQAVTAEKIKGLRIEYADQDGSKRKAVIDVPKGTLIKP